MMGGSWGWPAAAAALVPLLAGQSSGVSQRTPPPTILRAGALVDVVQGRTVPDATIVVADGLISYAGPSVGAPAKLPPGALEISLPRLTLTPGFIDAHVHLTLGGVATDNARATLEAGFTTVLDLGAVDGAVFALRRDIDAGQVIGPRVLAAGRWIGISGGTCDFNGIGVRGAAAFRERVNEEIRRGADIIKVCVSGWLSQARSDPQKYEISDEELTAAISEAHARGRRVAVHAISTAGIGKAVEMGADLVVHGGFVDAATVRRMKDRKIYLLPTLFSFVRSQPEPDVTALRAHLREAVAAGLPVAFGTDAGVIRHGNNGREFPALQELGLSPIDLLRTATTHAAAAVGLESSIGVLSSGRSADIVGLEGDPLRDPSSLQRVTFVMHRGVVVKR